MENYKKIGNVLGIIAAWLLSIALILSLIVTPIMLSALSLLNANTLLDVLTQAITGGAASGEDMAAAYSVDRLSNVAMPGEQQVTDDAGQIGGALLEGILGDKADQELVNEILASDVAKDFVKLYMDGLANAFTDGSAGKAFDENIVREFVSENIDRIVELAKQALPELSAADEQELRQAIQSAVDENAETFFNFLPKPEQIKDEIMEESPELAIVFQIIARKNTIKLAVIGVIVLLSGLIFLCRLPGLRGFRWLATDLFVGSGFCLLQSVGLLLGGSFIQGMLASEPQIAGAVRALVSSFTTGVTVRTVVMLLSAVGLLVVYIVIKKARTKKLACPAGAVEAAAEPEEAEAVAEGSENG